MFTKEKQEKTKENEKREAELSKFVQNRDVELESDVTTRLYGVKNYTGTGYRRAGYDILRRFYDGDQWTYSKSGGGTVRVFNYCQNTVTNYTAFLAAESPEIDIPPDDITDEFDVARAEVVETVINEILEDNEFPIIFEEAVQNGSLIGDSMIVGPFWDKDEKRIWFENVKRPEFVRIIWANVSYTKMLGYIMHYKMSLEKAEEVFKDQMKARGIESLAPDVPPSDRSQSESSRRSTRGSAEKETSNPLASIRFYWSSQEMILMVGDKVLDYVNHDWGFVPLIYVKNLSHPTEQYGISDIENKLDPQVEFNEGNSFISDILKADATPHVFGKNIELSEYKTNIAQIHDLGEEAEVFNNPLRGVTAPVEVFMNRVFNSMIQLSGENEVIYGGSAVREATGRALSVLMQAVNNRVKMREKRWRVGLKHLIGNILRLIELYVPNGKLLIQGRYKSDIFFPGSILRNVTEEINKFQAKIQSLYTTQKNAGVPSPSREQKLMKKELSDQQLAIEISRQPQLQMQFQQMMQQMIRQEVDRVANESPQMKEEDNQEARPASAAGVPVRAPVSPEGAVAQGAQQGGQAPLL